ncbi:hypothetical protein LTR42_008151 [Elasticomyces elasticus]|nr:hypothetical protein LTR42_008151 [Elasticomyces elasticus]
MSFDFGIDTLVPGEPGTTTVEQKYTQSWSRNGKTGTFITKFLVSHPADNISLRGITIKYYIHYNGEERRTYVGELIGDIVDREALDLDGSSKAWLREIFRECHSGDLRITFDDIYTREGKTRDKFKEHDDELQVQFVAHVAEFVVEPRLQGFGKLALIAFHYAMQDLIGFEGTIILCPGSMEPAAGLGKSEYEYEMGLVQFYEKCGYRIIYTEENVAGATVMGVMLINLLVLVSMERTRQEQIEGYMYFERVILNRKTTLSKAIKDKHVQDLGRYYGFLVDLTRHVQELQANIQRDGADDMREAVDQFSQGAWALRRQAARGSADLFETFRTRLLQEHARITTQLDEMYAASMNAWLLLDALDVYAALMRSEPTDEAPKENRVLCNDRQTILEFQRLMDEVLGEVEENLVDPEANISIETTLDPDNGKEILTGSIKCRNIGRQGAVVVFFDGPYNQKGFEEHHEGMQAKIEFQYDDSAHAEEIGMLDFHFVKKSARGARGKRLWVPKLLERKVEGRLKCTSAALKMLFDKSGRQRPGLEGREDELNADTVVYFETIELEKDWQGKQLGPAVMRIYHAMLRQYLDDAGAVMLMLQPAMLDNRGHAEEERVPRQAALLRMYGKLEYGLIYEEPGDSAARYRLMVRLL